MNSVKSYTLFWNSVHHRDVYVVWRSDRDPRDEMRAICGASPRIPHLLAVGGAVRFGRRDANRLGLAVRAK